GLIIAYVTICLPFAAWMSKGYFDSIPKELDEAALMDGARRSTILYRVILPVTLPGLGATFVFSVLGSWNEFLFALVLTDTVDVRTLPLGIANLIGQWITSWNVLMAAGVIFSIPPLILFLFLEKALVSGLTAGAVKG
ncbi:MAG TPA: carbohydrate ABC transporter permease, partial [Spirochaetia bacterium]|nr:carbohydrate ABC transporter permease [Spirochaetia bacterium]